MFVIIRDSFLQDFIDLFFIIAHLLQIVNEICTHVFPRINISIIYNRFCFSRIVTHIKTLVDVLRFNFSVISGVIVFRNIIKICVHSRFKIANYIIHFPPRRFLCFELRIIFHVVVSKVDNVTRCNSRVCPVCKMFLVLNCVL